MSDFTVHKLNHRGERVFSYTGEVLERAADFVCIRARFQRETMPLGYVTLKTGDMFTEWFYADRWYNVFRVEDVDSGELKGYYCNLTRPAQIHADYVEAEDLALDVFVRPDGETLILDAEEYEALPLSNAERASVTTAVEQIYELVRRRQGPFAELN